MSFQPAHDLYQAKQYINNENLDAAINRLVLVDKWSPQQANAACCQYRNFLYLKKKYGATYTLPPSYEIDEFWHAHILHTKQYSDFSYKVFGAFLHHHPHHGIDNTISKQQLEQLFEQQTQHFYHLEFNQYIYAIKPLPLQQRILGILGFLGKKQLVGGSEQPVFKQGG